MVLLTSRVCPSLFCALAVQKQNTVYIEKEKRYLFSMLAADICDNWWGYIFVGNNECFHNISA